VDNCASDLVGCDYHVIAAASRYNVTKSVSIGRQTLIETH